MTKIEKRGLGRGLSALISPAPVTLKIGVAPGEGAAALSILSNQSEPTVLVDDRGVVGNSRSTLTTVSDVVTKDLAPLQTDNSNNSLESGKVKFLPIEKIVGNPTQPRQHFSDAELEELSSSIKTLGVLQPILVRQKSNNYEIVAGERRWRAAQRAGLSSIPAMIRELSELEVLQIALVENVQRQQLGPIEEALAYERLMKEFRLTQEQVADTVGKNRASVANYLRLLKLAPEVVKFIEDGKITMGHAKALLTIKEPAAQINLSRKIVEEGLSVRAVESIVARAIVLEGKKTPKKLANIEATESSIFERTQYEHIEDQLRNALGTRVAVRGGKNGKIEIDYYSSDELTRIVDVICGN